MIEPEQKYLWRFADPHWGVNEDLIVIFRIPVVKVTAKGFWIYGDGVKNFGKFVLAGSGKRFAYETLEAAKASYLIRKTRQVSWLIAGLERAQKGLTLAEEGKFEEYKTGEFSWL